jgi:hypothetical protein
MSAKLRPRQYADAKGVIAEAFDGTALICNGTTVPTDATAGYHPGCLYFVRGVDGDLAIYKNDGSSTSCDFNLWAGGVDLSTLTATAAELNYLDADLATNKLTQGAGVDGAEGYHASIARDGGLIVTRIYVNLDDLVGSATDLDVIGESAAAGCHWGQITAAKSGTIVGGRITCLEVPTGGSADVDFYSSDVATGTQDVIITDAALGTETALVTAGGAWTLSAPVKAMSGLPAANDYIYAVNGAASGGTFTAGKFLIELFGV